MRICIISFDIWGFDSYIKKELDNQNIEAYHICLSQYKYEYKSILEKIKNFCYKFFLKKNIKHINREKYIIEELNRLGNFDQILVINPELISLETHKIIKSRTSRYVTFLYDSLDRMPIKKEILSLFDKIFSFDNKDCEKNNFYFITNYIYKVHEQPKTNYKYKAFCILSEDNRLTTLVNLDVYFKNLSLPSKFIIFNKTEKELENTNIVYTNKRISIDNVFEQLNESEIFIDLIRDNQTGLSFRVFESLAFQRKLITTNTTIKSFDFYNPNNILIIEKNTPTIPSSFLNNEYEPVPKELIDNYTISHWCKKVFNL